MSMVKVWNDNTIDHVEMFKEKEIRIPAGKHIEMELFEANDFKGQYRIVEVDAGGQQTRESMKMIRLERPKLEAVEDEAPEVHQCVVCKHASPSPEELEAHIKVRHAEQERLNMPDVDAEIKRSGKRVKAANE